LSDQIAFTGVVLKSFSRNHNGGAAKFSANYTAAVRGRMGWAEFPSGGTSMKLEGSLAASVATLQPTDGALAKWEIGFDATDVKAFEVVRYELEGKKKKGFRYELHFDIGFKDMTACKVLEEFITHIGDQKSTLTVAYTKAAEQTDLPLQTEDGRQATLPEND
jgi:hypothetical protein